MLERQVKKIEADESAECPEVRKERRKQYVASLKWAALLGNRSFSEGVKL